MARILLLSLVFPPDSVSTAQLMGELTEDLVKLGHSVEVITTMPHYNPPINAFAGIQRGFLGVVNPAVFKGAQVLHTYMPKKCKSKSLRVLSWMLFHLFSFFVGIRIPKVDLVIAPSPPLTIGVMVWLLARFHRAKCIYSVQEIYPDIAIRLGVIRNRIVVKLLFALEQLVYSRMDSITVIAPGMKRQLILKGVQDRKLAYIPNFVDTSNFVQLPKTNSFTMSHGLSDKFVVSYAGNFGPAQGLEVFIDAAFKLQNYERIHFVMLGDGGLRAELEERVTRLRLKNFTLLPYQPTSLMAMVYSGSSMSFVPQAARIGFDAIPSKVYRIMSCGCPVLAATEEDSDLAQLVVGSGAGIVVRPENAEALAGAILDMYKHPERLDRLGASGKRFVAEHYSRSQVVNQYQKLILTLLSSNASLPAMRLI